MKVDTMKEAPASSSAATAANSTNYHTEDWDAKEAAPLSNLFQYQIILSPSHGEDHGEEEGKAPVVAGEIIDFDEPALKNSSNSSAASTTGKHEDIDLELDMFDNLFEEGHHHPTIEEEEAKKEEPIVTTDEETKEHLVTSDEDSDTVSESSKSKRTTESKGEDQQDGDRPVKKPKTKEYAAPPITSVVVETKQQQKKMVEIKIEKLSIPSPPEPRKPLPGRRRPNCLFVNHFGTRLNDKGQAVELNVPKNSSSETVSLKTKSTASSSKSSKSGYSQKTPVNNVVTTAVKSSGSPSCSVPSVVRIVTPNVKKPITSSARIEDIHMEEDDLEPIHHENNNFLIDSEDLPYIHSLTAPNLHQGPHMIPGAMMGGPGGMPMNFHRPFPLLQRRAFLGGCHPMAGHPQAAAYMHGGGWPVAGFPPGMAPFPQQLASYGGGPAMAHSSMDAHAGATATGGKAEGSVSEQV